MEVLTKEEARSLFLDKVGHDGLCKNPNLEPILNEICDKCGGVLLVNVAIAASLKGNVDDHEWRTTLEELKGSTKGLNVNEMYEEVLDNLKVSYQRLKDKELQDCLLYCSLYPKNHEIDRNELIGYLIDEKILEEMSSRQAVFEKGHTMLNELQNACLFEGSESFVKMNDLVRDMALRIRSANPRFLVNAGVGLKHIPNQEDWTEDVVRVSLMDNNILDIPPDFSPRCPELSTLLLCRNYDLRSIPDCFLVHMDELSVLDLSCTNIECLPKSVTKLGNLSALLLGYCRSLKYVPSLETLKALRRLDLYHTRIRELPQGMEMLANLRYLNIETKDAYKFAIDGILPKLFRLQFLVLPLFTGMRWYSSRRTKVKGDELASLRNLETFQGILYNVNNFNTYVRSLEDGGPTNYLLQVGDDEFVFGLDDYGYNKNVLLTESEISENIPGEYSLLLPKDIELLLIGKCTVKGTLSEVASLKNAPDLRSCSIYDCDGLEYLISSYSVPLLQSLEELTLVRLPDFRGLINREGGASSLLSPTTFSSLKTISIENWPNVNKLFTPMLLSRLQNLENLKVSECAQMVEIIADEEEDQNQEEEISGSKTFCLPKLRTLTLDYLKDLKCFCSGEKVVVANSLQNIAIYECPKLKRIPLLDEDTRPPSLKYLEVEEEWWESLEWKHPDAKEALKPLCDFI